MMLIITFTFCCNNLWRSKFTAPEKPGKLSEFFSRTLCRPCQRNVGVLLHVFRDALIASILDGVRASGNRDVHVKMKFTQRGYRLGDCTFRPTVYSTHQ